jgi:2-iminoacetate synthase ThiH
MTRRQIEEFIREAGRIPVERDTLYHELTRPADPALVAKDGGA